MPVTEGHGQHPELGSTVGVSAASPLLPSPGCEPERKASESRAFVEVAV